MPRPPRNPMDTWAAILENSPVFTPPRIRDYMHDWTLGNAYAWGRQHAGRRVIVVSGPLAGRTGRVGGWSAAHPDKVLVSNDDGPLIGITTDIEAFYPDATHGHYERPEDLDFVDKEVAKPAAPAKQVIRNKNTRVKEGLERLARVEEALKQGNYKPEEPKEEVNIFREWAKTTNSAFAIPRILTTVGGTTAATFRVHYDNDGWNWPTDDD